MPAPALRRSPICAISASISSRLRMSACICVFSSSIVLVWQALPSACAFVIRQQVVFRVVCPPFPTQVSCTYGNLSIFI